MCGLVLSCLLVRLLLWLILLLLILLLLRLLLELVLMMDIGIHNGLQDAVVILLILLATTSVSLPSLSSVVRHHVQVVGNGISALNRRFAVMSSGMVSIAYLIHCIQIRRRVGRACTVAVGDAIEDRYRIEVGLYSSFPWPLLLLGVYLNHIRLVWL